MYNHKLDPESNLKNLVPAAVQTLEDNLSDRDGKVRQAAAKMILEANGLGKPAEAKENALPVQMVASAIAALAMLAGRRVDAAELSSSMADYQAAPVLVAPTDPSPDFPPLAKPETVGPILEIPEYAIPNTPVAVQAKAKASELGRFFK